MLRLLRKIINFLFWWFIIIGCVALIGYILWPLFADKFYSLCSNNSRWLWCRGEWGSITSADKLQKQIEQKAGSLVNLSTTAASDVLTDKSGKMPVIYQKNEVGVFVPVKQ